MNRDRVRARLYGHGHDTIPSPQRLSETGEHLADSTVIIAEFVGVAWDNVAQVSRQEQNMLKTRMYAYGISAKDVLTGEATSRVSEGERKLALELSGAMGKGDDWEAQFAKMKELTLLLIRNEEILRKERGLPPMYALDKEGIVESFIKLRERNMPVREAKAFLDELMERSGASHIESLNR